MSKPHKEAKRLAKSVKHHRTYGENLRNTASRIRAYSQTLDSAGGIGAGDIERAFADRLDDLADAEFATAREKDKAHREAMERKSIANAPRPINPDEEARVARALGLLAERGSIARVRYLAKEVGVGDGLNHGASDLMKMVEAKIDEEMGDTSIERSAMQFGARINFAETRMFGKPRF